MSQYDPPEDGQSPPDEEPRTQIRPAGSSTSPQYGNPQYANGEYAPAPPSFDKQPPSPPSYDAPPAYTPSPDQGWGPPPQGYGPPQDHPQGYPPQQGYGQQPPYGGGYPVQGAPYGYGQPTGAYAGWGDRVVATLWDILYLWPAYLLMFVAVIVVAIGGGLAAGDAEGLGTIILILGLLALLAAYVWAIWRYVRNYMIDQGRTGYTYGKRKVGIRTVLEATGQPSGVGSCVGRYFLHALINYAFLIDYLWPLWDEKKQTLTDKVLSTVVVKQPV